MAASRVTGVLWWEMGISHFKAIFRRGNSAGYTKDFLQATHRIEAALEQMFDARPPFKITYRWPSGGYPGKIYYGTDRLEIGQWTTGAPGPWQLGDPDHDALVTLVGDPHAAIPSEADEQWEAIEETEPWLMMVQLDGNQEELHLRAYLGNPPPELGHASLEHVPTELRGLMSRRGGLAGGELPPLWFDPDDLRYPWQPTAPLGVGSTPTSSVAPKPPRPLPPGPLGRSYRPADEQARSAAPEPFDVDPDQRDRGTRAHAVTQNELAELATQRGFEARSPRDGEPNYDIGWEENGVLVVVEVKSVNAENAEKQLRLGLGQLLSYRFFLEEARRETRCAIAISAPPHDPRWSELCESCGIGLIWKPDLEPMLTAWLDAYPRGAQAGIGVSRAK